MRGLKIANSRIRDAILNGIPASGPPSLKSNWARGRYVAPEGLDEAFKEALNITGAEMKKCEARANELEKLVKGGSADAKTEAELHKLRVRQHLYDPEVQYNHLVKDVNLELPVFRFLAHRDWKKRDMLLLMQRIEQHHVIPDTLPTLDPRAKVDVKFPTPAARWLEPGEILSSTVTERLPEIRVTDYSKEGLYTILVVNPDVPVPETDSYKTALHFGAVNVPISFAKNLVDAEQGTVFQEYVPPHANKNLPAQRFCVWVLRQSEVISDVQKVEDSFDIRGFVDSYNLDPVGVQLWRSKWDRYVPALREKYGLGPGAVYYRARTDKPEEALLHIRHHKEWPKVE